MTPYGRDREARALAGAERRELLDSARHWERLADEAERQAAWDRDRGIDLSAPGASAGDFKARSYRSTARTLRLHAKTGVPHCGCHERPRSECPYSGQGVRV